MGGKPKSLTDHQKMVREKLLMAFPKAIRKLEADLANLLYGDSRHTFVQGITELKRIHAAIQCNRQKCDASLLAFFPGHPEYKDEDAFLKSEMLDRLYQFLSRGLFPVQAIFRKEGVELPKALKVLHEEYNSEKVHLPLQQHWFSSVYPDLASMIAEQRA